MRHPNSATTNHITRSFTDIHQWQRFDSTENGLKILLNFPSSIFLIKLQNTGHECDLVPTAQNKLLSNQVPVVNIIWKISFYKHNYHLLDNILTKMYW